MMDPLSVALLCLACWRLTSLLYREAGPGKILLHLRELFGVKHSSVDDSPIGWPDTFFGDLLGCPFCISVWIGGILAILYFFFPSAMGWISLPFALSAIACLGEIIWTHLGGEE